MQRVIMAILVAGTALMGAAQASQASGQQGKYKKNYEKALKAEFVEFGGWITDYDEARVRAEKEGKLIFAFFSRSYAP